MVHFSLKKTLVLEALTLLLLYIKLFNHLNPFKMKIQVNKNCLNLLLF